MVGEELHWILKWCGYIGIVPFYNKQSRTFKINHIYSYVAIAICVASMVVSVEGGIRLSGYSLSITDIFGILCNLMTCALNVGIIFSACHQNAERLQSIFDKMRNIDSEIGNLHMLRLPSKILLHAIFAIVSAGEFTLIVLFLVVQYYHTEWKKYYVVFNNTIQFYWITAAALFQYSLLAHIRKRFSCLNIITRNFDDSLGIVDMKAKRGVQVDALGRLHGELCDCVDIFNDAFGWHIFGNFICCIISVLRIINRSLSNHTGTMLSTSLVRYVIMIGALSFKGEMLAREGVSCKNAAYRALNRHVNLAHLKDRLFAFAQQTSSRMPSVSAGGFFAINYTTIFMFVNLLTTYVIVIIQLRPN